jgi:hypothetical protein
MAGGLSHLIHLHAGMLPVCCRSWERVLFSQVCTVFEVEQLYLVPSCE